VLDDVREKSLNNANDMAPVIDTLALVLYLMMCLSTNCPGMHESFREGPSTSYSHHSQGLIRIAESRN